MIAAAAAVQAGSAVVIAALTRRLGRTTQRYADDTARIADEASRQSEFARTTASRDAAARMLTAAQKVATARQEIVHGDPATGVRLLSDTLFEIFSIGISEIGAVAPPTGESLARFAAIVQLGVREMQEGRVKPDEFGEALTFALIGLGQDLGPVRLGEPPAESRLPAEAEAIAWLHAHRTTAD